MYISKEQITEYIKALDDIQKEIIKQCDEDHKFSFNSATRRDAYHIASRILAAHMISREVDGIN